MSLAAELREALRGPVVDLGRPQRVALPWANLGSIRACTADLKSLEGRKGFHFLKTLICRFTPLVAELMCFCMLRFLSRVIPSDLAESISWGYLGGMGITYAFKGYLVQLPPSCSSFCFRAFILNYGTLMVNFSHLPKILPPS